MRKKILLLIVAIFIVLLILLLSVFFMYYNTIIEPFPPSLSGNLVPIEINRTEDYMVFELRNITVYTSSSLQESEKNIALYDASGNYTIYNVLVTADDRTYYFNATWSYDDVDGNGFINTGDHFILYNISAYDAEPNPHLFFAVKGYGRLIGGKINTSLMKGI